MVPVKIECGCGQRYTFDVEPEDGHMPVSVTCPACGADGTAAANDGIAMALAALRGQAVPAPTSAATVPPAKSNVQKSGAGKAG